MSSEGTNRYVQGIFWYSGRSRPFSKKMPKNELFWVILYNKSVTFYPLSILFPFLCHWEELSPKYGLQCTISAFLYLPIHSGNSCYSTSNVLQNWRFCILDPCLATCFTFLHHLGDLTPKYGFKGTISALFPLPTNEGV